MKQEHMALFTMDDVETELYGTTFAEFAEQKKKGGIGRTVRNAALGAAGVGVLAAAGRYGLPGAGVAKRTYQGFRRQGLGRKAALGKAARAGMQKATRLMGRDAAGAKRGFSNLRSKVGSMMKRKSQPKKGWSGGVNPDRRRISGSSGGKMG